MPRADMFPCLVSLLECLFLPARQDPPASNRAAPGAQQRVMAIMRRGPEDGKGVQLCHQPQDSVAFPAVVGWPMGQTQLWLRPLALLLLKQSMPRVGEPTGTSRAPWQFLIQRKHQSLVWANGSAMKQRPQRGDMGAVLPSGSPALQHAQL